MQPQVRGEEQISSPERHAYMTQSEIHRASEASVNRSQVTSVSMYSKSTTTASQLTSNLNSQQQTTALLFTHHNYITKSHAHTVTHTNTVPSKLTQLEMTQYCLLTQRHSTDTT